MRTKNVIKNLAAGFINRIVVEIVKFVVRTVFIYHLSEAFLGATGLFTNILNVLNIAELGIGGSISAALYRPLAEGDRDQIKALMNLYKKFYRVIGIFILLMGAILSLFIPYIVKERIEGLNLYVVFYLYLLNSVVSYLFYAYKATLLTADQKNYKVTFLSTFFSIIVAMAQIFVLSLPMISPTEIFYLYLSVGILGNIVTNLFTAWVVDKQYSYINEKNIIPIASDARKKFFQNVGALSISKISSAALNSTDSIIVSAVLINGLSVVGKYSNYTIIISAINSVFIMISQSITATVGNYIVKESKLKTEQLFNCIYVIFTWMYGFCFVCLLCLLNSFIGGIWLSNEWRLSNQLVFLLSLNFLLNGMDFAPVKFIQAAGLYWQAKYRYIISTTLNIVLSILFGVALKWNLEGVVFATTLALIGMTCMDPYVVFKHLFNKHARLYYIRYFVSFIVIVVTGAFTKLVCEYINLESAFGNFIIDAIICLLLPNIIWFLLLFKTKMVQDVLETIVKHT